MTLSLAPIFYVMLPLFSFIDNELFRVEFVSKPANPQFFRNSGSKLKRASCPSIQILGSIVVSIPACHAGDRGSIPRRGGLNIFLIRNNLSASLYLFLLSYLRSVGQLIYKFFSSGLTDQIKKALSHRVNLTASFPLGHNCP